MNKILEIIKDPMLTYEQTVLSLARAAEDELSVLDISPELQSLRDEGIICDLFEGNAPYRPRYIVPDYEKFMKNGCKFLDLEVATDIHEATNNLLIFYKHVPSITSFPVYIGSLDKLLDPFVKDDDESFRAIKRFLKHIDRTITDSFCHANIGPEDSLAARLILRAERELENSIPNLTMKFDLSTSDEFAIDAINTALITAKPSFANNDIFKTDFSHDYAIVSCYNGLPIGGGSYTLARVNLSKLSNKTESLDEFINIYLPYTVRHMLAYMDERISFIVEEAPFFKSNFLVREGFIDINKFTAMFGIVGLAEAVNHFVEDSDKLENRFGHSRQADELGLKIMDVIDKLVSEHVCEYLYASKSRYLLHAQVGLDSDTNTSPGCRIPIGDEPEIYKHIIQASQFHKYFPSGVGDIFNFDAMAKNNPEYVLDILKGGFKSKLRYFSAYSTDSDVIRITGYLVKKSEIEKLKAGSQVLRDTVALGLGSVENNKVLERKIR